MTGPRYPLELINIPVPCGVPWETMTGDDRVRVCGTCRKAVYQLKNYTRAEAELLLGALGGDACVQVYRRPDGTVLTADCTPRSGGVGAVLLNCAFTLLGAALAVVGVGVLNSRNATSTFSFVGGGIGPSGKHLPGGPVDRGADTSTP